MVPCPGSSDAVALADGDGEGDGRVDGAADAESLGPAEAVADSLAAPAGVGEATGVEHADSTTSSTRTPGSQAERGIA